MKITGENNETLKHKIQEKRKGICDFRILLICTVLRQTPGLCNEMVFFRCKKARINPKQQS